MDGMAMIEWLTFGVNTLHRSRGIHEIRNPDPDPNPNTNTKPIVVKVIQSMQGMAVIDRLKFGFDTVHRSRVIHEIRNPDLTLTLSQLT